MSQELSCYHGHRFDVPQQAGRSVVCPLCGAVTTYRRAGGDTRQHGGHEQTLNQPHTAPLETSQDGSIGKTLNIDTPIFRDEAVMKTGSFEPPPSTREAGNLPRSDSRVRRRSSGQTNNSRPLLENRSEERRVGKECKSRWAPERIKQK